MRHEHTRQLKQFDFTIRSMEDHDLKKVIEIERESFDEPIKIKELRCTHRHQSSIMKVGELVTHNGRMVIAYLIGVWWTDHYEITAMSVDHRHRKQGFGRRMLAEFKDVADIRDGFYVETTVPERDLPSQLFFRKNGFRWVQTKKGFWSDDKVTNDGYVLRYPG